MKSRPLVIGRLGRGLIPLTSRGDLAVIAW